jgi:hypothetical protein
MPAGLVGLVVESAALPWCSDLLRRFARALLVILQLFLELASYLWGILSLPDLRDLEVEDSLLDREEQENSWSIWVIRHLLDHGEKALLLHWPPRLLVLLFFRQLRVKPN